MKIDSSLMQLEDSLPDIDDIESKDDPVFDCPEYANDIYTYLLEVTMLLDREPLRNCGDCAPLSRSWMICSNKRFPLYIPLCP